MTPISSLRTRFKTILPVFIFVLLLITSNDSIGHAQGEGAVGVEISAINAQTEFAADQDVTLSVTISNQTSSAVKILKWMIPFNQLPNPVFSVILEDNQVPYYGPLAKRLPPTEQDYLTLAPGELLNGEVTLSTLFDFSESGNYEISLNMHSPALYWENNQAVEGNLVSNNLIYSLAGRANLLTEGIIATAISGSNSFASCDASEETDIINARISAGNYADNADSYFSNGNKGARYIYWFGEYKSSRYDKVKSNYVKIGTAVDSADFSFDCSGNAPCEPNTFAYVYANAPYDMYFCNAFWTAPQTGTDSKAGTIIHETSHYDIVADTVDYVYGQTNAKNLARWTPGLAKKNADNYEYFAEDNPPIQDKPITISPNSSIGDRTPTFTWTPVSVATKYKLEVWKGSKKVYSDSVSISDCGSSQCSNAPGTKLGLNKTYKWRVKAKVGGEWVKSSFMSFTVTGFNSSFNTNMKGWSVLNGKWLQKIGYIQSKGVADEWSSIYYSKDDYTSFTYEVKMRRTAENSYANALEFRGNPFPFDSPGGGWDDGYYFAYSNVGSFVIGYDVNGVYTFLIPWTASPAINQGGWNTLKVTAQGDFIQWFINGTRVAYGNLAVFSSGKVGIYFFRDAEVGTLKVTSAKLDTSPPTVGTGGINIDLLASIQSNGLTESSLKGTGPGVNPNSNDSEIPADTPENDPTQTPTVSPTEQPTEEETVAPSPTEEPPQTFTPTPSPTEEPAEPDTPTPSPTEEPVPADP